MGNKLLNILPKSSQACDEKDTTTSSCVMTMKHHLIVFHLMYTVNIHGKNLLSLNQLYSPFQTLNPMNRNCSLLLYSPFQTTKSHEQISFFLVVFPISDHQIQWTNIVLPCCIPHSRPPNPINRNCSSLLCSPFQTTKPHEQKLIFIEAGHIRCCLVLGTGQYSFQTISKFWIKWGIQLIKNVYIYYLSSSSHLIYLLTMKVIRALQMISQPAYRLHVSCWFCRDVKTSNHVYITMHSLPSLSQLMMVAPSFSSSWHILDLPLAMPPVRPIL